VRRSGAQSTSPSPDTSWCQRPRTSLQRRSVRRALRALYGAPAWSKALIRQILLSGFRLARCRPAEADRAEADRAKEEPTSLDR